MYGAIVDRKVNRIWAAPNARDTSPQLDGMADNFSHTFLGDHAMGGTPWNTVVLTWIDVTVPFENEVSRNSLAQCVELKWGKVHDVINTEDTQLLAMLLEAASAPITGS